MSEKLCLLVEAMCRNLYEAVLMQAALPSNNHCGAAFYGMWFHSPLAQNNYIPPRQRAAAPTTTTVVATVPERSRAMVAASAAPEKADDGRRRIKMMTHDDVMRTAQHKPTTIAVDETSASVTTQNTRGAETLSALYGAEQRVAVEALRDTMERCFALQQVGVVGQIAQTLLVLALEPIDFGVELVLLQRFDANLVVENLLHIEAQQSGRADAAAFFGDDDEAALEDGERVRTFRRQFKKMTVNFFRRFPELAIECSETTARPLLCAVSSFWITSGTLFEHVRMLPHSEAAHTLRAPFQAIFERVLGDRADLLYATITTNIEGIGPRRWHQFRELFVAGLLDAHQHVASLVRLAGPDDTRFARAQRALYATYERVRNYCHSAKRE